MSDDRLFTFDCVEEGSYTRTFTVAVVSQDQDDAEAMAKRSDGNVLANNCKKQVERVNAELIRTEPLSFDSVLEINDPPLRDGGVPSTSLEPIIEAIEQALDTGVEPTQIGQAIRSHFPVLFG